MNSDNKHCVLQAQELLRFHYVPLSGAHKQTKWRENLKKYKLEGSLLSF